MKAVSTLALLAALLTGNFVAFGHGSMSSPISRVYRIYLENPENPQSAAGRAAVAVAGTQAFYDWHEVNLRVPDYNYPKVIPDGQLASAGRAKYAGLDLVRSDWPKTAVHPGPYHMVFNAHVPHDPSFFTAFISRADWNPMQPLRWADLEPLDGAQYFRREGNLYTFDTVFPPRRGHHVIYVIWQRIDPAGEVFFSLSDVDFGDGSGYGNPQSGGGTVPRDGIHPSGTNYLADFRVTSDWGTGFNGEVTLQNKSPYLLNGWNLSFMLDGQISTFWNVTSVRQDGSTYYVSNDDHNRAIGAGQQTSFGFTASPGTTRVGVPHHFVLNGLPLHPDEWTGNILLPTNNPVPPPPPTPTPTPTPTPPPGSTNAGPVAVEYREDSRWGDGFTSTIRIINSGNTAIKGWTLAFQLNGTVPKYWGAVSRNVSGSIYTFGNETWNGTIAPGASVTFGFQAVAGPMAKPTAFKLNGKSITPLVCGSGGLPTPVVEPAQAKLALKVTSNWGSGFTAAATVTQVAGSNLDGWTLTFDFPHRITSLWDAELVSRVGNRYTLKNAAWNRSLKTGSTVTFGFNAEPGGTIGAISNVSIK